MIRLKNQKKWIIFVSILLLLGCQSKEISQRTIFSWHKQEILEGRKDFLQTIRRYKIQTIYQYFSNDLTNDQISMYLDDCFRNDTKVYYLCGEPEYALLKHQDSLYREIENAIHISDLDTKQVIKGVVLDIEPYILDDFDKHSSKIMSQFNGNLERIYAYTKAHDLELIVCIPYYYDDLGLYSFLEKLIKDQCDGIAIMNYYQAHETEHIQTEMQLVQKYQKKCINIFELTAPQDGIDEKNTYYEEGIDMAIKHFEDIQGNYKYKDLSFAFHEYQYLKELSQYE